jgi:hypothetical protein
MFLFLKELLNEIPTIGMGIDFSSNPKAKKNYEQISNENVDLTKALFNTSFDDSLLDISNQSFTNLNESLNTSMSFQHNENDKTITEILALNENEKNEINELWTKRDSRSSSGSSSPSIDDLIAKRKVKKYAIEADPKLVKNFNDIKPKLCSQVRERKTTKEI